MRSIDADALRKAVNDFFDNSFEGLVSSDLIKYAQAVDDFIDNAPTLEGTAEWEYTDNRWGLGDWRCSACDGYSNKDTHYCPNCGRRMKI